MESSSSLTSLFSPTLSINNAKQTNNLLDFEEQIRKIQKNKILLGQQSSQKDEINCKNQQIKQQTHIEQFPAQIIGLKSIEVRKNQSINEQRIQPKITDSTQQAIRLLSSNFTLNKNGMMINKEIKPETAAQIQFYPNDRVLNLKISTVEKLRLLKRNEITKSMKFIRSQGKHLLKIRQHMRKYYEYIKANEQKEPRKQYSSLQIQNINQNKMLRQQTSLQINQNQIRVDKKDILKHSQSFLLTYGNDKEQFQDKFINDLNLKSQFYDGQLSRNFAKDGPDSNSSPSKQNFFGQSNNDLRASKKSKSLKKNYLYNPSPNKQFSNSNSISSQSLSRTMDFKKQKTFEKNTFEVKKVESNLDSLENDLNQQKSFDYQFNSLDSTPIGTANNSARSFNQIFPKTKNIVILRKTEFQTSSVHESNNNKSSQSSHSLIKTENITKMQEEQEKMFEQILQNEEEEYYVEDSSNESIKPQSDQNKNLQASKNRKVSDDCQRYMTQVDETTDENHESESQNSKKILETQNLVKSRKNLVNVLSEESQQSQGKLSANHESDSDAELNDRLSSDFDQQLQKKQVGLKQNKFAQKNKEFQDQEELVIFSQNPSQNLNNIDNLEIFDNQQHLKLGDLSQISEEPENDFDKTSGEVTKKSKNSHRFFHVFQGGSMKNLSSILNTQIQQTLKQNQKRVYDTQTFNSLQNFKFQTQMNLNQNLQIQPDDIIFYQKDQLDTKNQSKMQSKISNSLSSSSLSSLARNKYETDQNFELQQQLEEFIMPQLVFKNLGDTSSSIKKHGETSGSYKKSQSQSPTDHEQLLLNNSNFNKEMKQNLLNEISKINDESSFYSEQNWLKNKKSEEFSFQKFATESQKIFQVQLKKVQNKNQDSSSELAESYDSEAARIFSDIFTGSQTQQKDTSSIQKKVHEIASEEQATMSLIDNPEGNLDFKNQPQQQIENLCLQQDDKNEYNMEEEEEELVSDDESEKVSAQEYFQKHILDLLNNINPRRDDFIHDEQSLDDLEEFYLSQIEQQCHADQITKLAKQDINLREELKLLKQKSELNKQYVINQQFSVDLSASSSALKGIISPEITPIVSGNTSEKKITFQNANTDSQKNIEYSKKKLMELRAKIQKQEMSKKQFAFNLNSNQDRKLSDHDLFKNSISPQAQLSPLLSFNHSNQSNTETQHILTLDFINANHSDLINQSSFYTALKDQSNQQTLRQGNNFLRRPSLKKSLVRPILKIAKSQLSLKMITLSNLRKESLSIAKEERSPDYKPFDTTQNKHDSFQFEFEPFGREVIEQNSISSQTLSSKHPNFQYKSNQWSLNQVELKRPKKNITSDNLLTNKNGNFHESGSLYGYQKKIDLVQSIERDLIRKNLRRILEVTSQSQKQSNSSLQDDQSEEVDQQDSLSFVQGKNMLQSLIIKKQETKLSLSLESLKSENKDKNTKNIPLSRNGILNQELSNLNKINRIKSYDKNSAIETKIDAQIIAKKNTLGFTNLNYDQQQTKMMSSKRFLSVRVSSSSNNQDICDKNKEYSTPQRFLKQEQSFANIYSRTSAPFMDSPQTSQFPQNNNLYLQAKLSQNQEELKLEEEIKNQEENYDSVEIGMTFDNIEIPRRIQQSQIPENLFQDQIQINPQMINNTLNQSAIMSQFLSFNLSGTQNSLNEQQNLQILTQSSQFHNNHSNAKRGRQTANQKNLQIPFRQSSAIPTQNQQGYNQITTTNQNYFSQQRQSYQEQNNINQQEFINIQQIQNQFQISQYNYESPGRNTDKFITQDSINITSIKQSTAPKIYYHLKKKQVFNFPSDKNYFRFSNQQILTGNKNNQEPQVQQTPIWEPQTSNNSFFENKSKTLTINQHSLTSNKLFDISPKRQSIDRKSVKNEAARRVLSLSPPKPNNNLKKLKHDMEGLYKAIEIKHGTVSSPFSQKHSKQAKSGFSSHGQAYRNSFFISGEAKEDHFFASTRQQLLCIGKRAGRNQVNKTMVFEKKQPQLFVYCNQLAQTMKQPVSKLDDIELQKKQQFLREWKPKSLSRNHIRTQTMTSTYVKQSK